LTPAEAGEAFPCFGSTCSVFVIADAQADATLAVAGARRQLLGWHERFTRFEPTSELMLLNQDPRWEVPVSPLMARFVDAVLNAAELTEGLVDATLLTELQDAGYRDDLPGGVSLRKALRLAPPRKPARPSPAARWRSLSVDLDANVVWRPPGLKLDSGGLAKGLFADVLAGSLDGHRSFAVECAGDLRLGGRGAGPRTVLVESPFDGQVLHTFALRDCGVATTGIGKRSWLDERGHPAHHLLDPSTGRPAYTGVVQATAIAPTAVEAEARAKAAVLSGRENASDWMPHGGVLVCDDGSTAVVRGGTGNGQGSRTERQERQAVRGPSEEGHEQVARSRDLELRGIVEQGRQEQR
jgi:thiamine biosynthesis lipoprotein